MSHTLALGDILQLGHKEPCQDAMGVMIMPAYEDAEFEILLAWGSAAPVIIQERPRTVNETETKAASM